MHLKNPLGRIHNHSEHPLDRRAGGTENATQHAKICLVDMKTMVIDSARQAAEGRKGGTQKPTKNDLNVVLGHLNVYHILPAIAGTKITPLMAKKAKSDSQQPTRVERFRNRKNAENGTKPAPGARSGAKLTHTRSPDLSNTPHGRWTKNENNSSVAVEKTGVAKIKRNAS